MPSRNRSSHLFAAVRTLHALASGRHQVRYVIGCDHDDPDTIGTAHILRLEIPDLEIFCTVRLPSLGQMVNRMVEKYPADAYCALSDDVEVLTRDWDDRIHDCWAAKPDGVWWWRTLKVRPATYAIVSDKWRRAAGQIFTDYFPFWWDDMWLMQVWAMASGSIGLAVEATLDDRAFATHRMRDLRFWADFYSSLKPRRWQEAKTIARKLGWPEPTETDVICDVRPEFLLEAQAIERQQGDKNPPTPEYLLAKRRAERLMAVAVAIQPQAAG